jgi:hypothetical protein
MDNQQETLYIAGLFEGEGSIQINKILVYGKILQYRQAVQFTNTEPEIAQRFVDYLKANGWNYHVHIDKRENKSRLCYGVTITKLKDRQAFLERMYPHFVGKKRRESELSLKFLQLRLALENPHERSKTNGRFLPNVSSFDKEQIGLYEEFKKIRGSPETTREAPIQIG